MPGALVDILLEISGEMRGAVAGGTNIFELDRIRELIRIRPGTGELGVADLAFQDVRPLAAGASENLDLSGLLKDSFEQVFTPAEITLIVVGCDSQATGTVEVGGAASNRFDGALGNGTYAVAAGDLYWSFSDDGWPVVPGTGDQLRIKNNGAAATTYTITVLGRSVAAA